MRIKNFIRRLLLNMLCVISDDWSQTFLYYYEQYMTPNKDKRICEKWTILFIDKEEER